MRTETEMKLKLICPVLLETLQILIREQWLFQLANERIKYY